MIEKFLDAVREKDILQHKYLETSLSCLEVEDKATFCKIITYFLCIDGYDIEKLAEAYLMMVNDVRSETKYFLENGKYRNSTYEEVKSNVYFNDNYMEQYMLGLVLSDYIWQNHLLITKWLKNQFIQIDTKGKYLEIGPGFGLYFLLAIENTNFTEYRAVDLSPKSVEEARKFVEYFCRGKKNWSIVCEDFFSYKGNEKFDCIVMGEVLEHVENPERMLRKIHSLLNVGGISYISTVINAPAIDHIYLFSSVEDVLRITEKSGFVVEEYLCTTENNVPLEKAIKQKRAITIIMKLRG